MHGEAPAIGGHKSESMANNILSASASSGVPVITGSPELQQIKKDLAAALVKAGVLDAKASDPYPKGFPTGVTWNEAYRMVSRRVEDNNPATPGTLVIDDPLLNTNLKSATKLAQLGVQDLKRFPKGTSVYGAIDALYRVPANGKLAGVFASYGIYDLRAFPDGTSLFQAYKLIEDPAKPGEISRTRYAEYQAASKALKSLDITTLVNFPRGTTVLEANAMLEPKATQMLAMVGVDKSLFKDPNISPLSAMAILIQLPDSLREMKALPAGESSQNLSQQASAAKKLVSMGYESLTPFASMKSFASEAPRPTTVFGVVKKMPTPADLPGPTAASSERLFMATNQPMKRSYGQPNPVSSSIYQALPSEKVTPRTIPPFKVVTAAEVLAFNLSFWPQRSIAPPK